MTDLEKFQKAKTYEEFIKLYKDKNTLTYLKYKYNGKTIIKQMPIYEWLNYYFEMVAENEN